MSSKSYTCLPWLSKPAVQAGRTIGSPRSFKENSAKSKNSVRFRSPRSMQHLSGVFSNLKQKPMIDKGKSVSDFLESPLVHDYFGGLTKSQLNAASRCFTVERFLSGEYIHIIGDESDCVYILVKGEISLRLRKPNQTNEAMELKSVAQGEVFGEVDFILDLPVRMEMKAVKESCVLRLSRETYLRYHKERYLYGLTDYMLGKGINIISSCLEHVKFFSTLNQEQLQSVAGLFRAVFFKKGQVVVKEGEEASSLLVLSSGEVVITHSGETEEFEIELARMKPGETFGDQALLEGDYKRTASIVATRDTVMLELCKDYFAEFLETAEPIRKKLMVSIDANSAITASVKKIPFLRDVQVHKLHLLQKLSKIKHYESGAIIMKQGVVNDRFFIVHTGHAEVIIDGKIVRTLGEGDYFGELSIVSDDITSSATIVAKHPNGVDCLECSRENFNTLFLTESGVLAEIEIKIQRTKTELKHMLNHPVGRDAFKEHCEKEYAKENFEFWTAVNRLHLVEKQLKQAHTTKDKDVLTKEILQKQCKYIYDTYIHESSDHMINIQCNSRQELDVTVQSDALSFKMFDKAQDEIYALMERDNFYRFKDSPKFHRMMSSIGCYKNMDESRADQISQVIQPISDKVLKEQKIPEEISTT